jgi:polyisoprenoid-binding protein YceI
MMISTVRGQFGGVKGTVVYDPRDPAASSVDATINVSTLNTGEKQNGIPTLRAKNSSM